MIGQNLIAVSNHYMENSMPYLACLPVGGASLANDDVMRGGGAAEIGMWRKQVRASASSHTNLEPLVIILLLFILLLFILLYFIIYLLNERRRPRKH